MTDWLYIASREELIVRVLELEGRLERQAATICVLREQITAALSGLQPEERPEQP